MKNFILILLTTFLISCSSSGTSPKSVLSLWTNINTGVPIDLSQFTLGVEEGFNLFFDGGAVCECNLIIIGTTVSGTMSLNSCYYRTGSGLGDPLCNSLNDVATYSVINNILTVVSASGFDEFRKSSGPENPLFDAIKKDYY